MSIRPGQFESEIKDGVLALQLFLIDPNDQDAVLDLAFELAGSDGHGEGRRYRSVDP